MRKIIITCFTELLSSEKIHVKVLCEVCVNTSFEDHIMLSETFGLRLGYELLTFASYCNSRQVTCNL